MPSASQRTCPARRPLRLPPVRALGVGVFGCAAWALAGCSHTVGQIVGEAAAHATPAVIDASVDALHEPAMRQQLLEIIQSSEVQRAVQLLMARLLDGTLDALTGEARAARLAQLADRLAASMAEAVGRTLHAQLAPEITAAVAQGVTAALQSATTPENEARIGALVTLTVERAVATLASQLRPTLRVVLREDVGPALRDALNDKATQDALAQAMRGLTRQAVLGMQDGLAEIAARQKAPEGAPSLLEQLQALAADGSHLARWAALVLAALVAGLLVWLARTRARVAHATRVANRHEASLLALARAVQSTDGQPWAGELRAVLDAALGDDAQAEPLRALWRKDPAPPVHSGKNQA